MRRLITDDMQGKTIKIQFGGGMMTATRAVISLKDDHGVFRDVRSGVVFKSTRDFSDPTTSVEVIEEGEK